MDAGRDPAATREKYERKLADREAAAAARRAAEAPAAKESEPV